MKEVMQQRVHSTKRGFEQRKIKRRIVFVLKRRKEILLILALVGAVAVLTACAAPAEKVLATPGGFYAAGTPGAGGTAIVLPTATPLPEGVKPIQGGVLQSYFSTDPSYWDPMGGTAGAVGEWNRVTSSLLQFNNGPGTEKWSFAFDTKGSLAESWEVSADALTYTFHIRKGVLWQNKAPVNGRELVAEDIKWTYERHMTTAGAPRRSQLEVIKSIDCPDKYTVVIKLKEPRADFLLTLATPYLEIVPREAEPLFKTSDGLIGFGPFMLDDYVVSTRIVYKKNPTYYRANEGLPHLDGIYYVNIADSSTSLAAFRSEKIDIRSISRVDLASVKETNPNIYCYEGEITASSYAQAFRTDKLPFSDVRLRRAVSLSINRQEVINTFYLGYAVPQLGPIHVASEWYLGDEEMKKLAKYQDYNPEEARRLIAEAGYPNGIDVSFAVWSAGDMEYEQYLVDALGKVGMRVTLKPYETTAWYTVVYNQKNYDDMTFLTVWAGGTFGPDIWLNQIYMTGAGSNYSRVSDPKLDEMMQAQTVEMDPVKRKAIIDDIQRYVIEQAYYVYGHHSFGIACWQPWVRDYVVHAASYHTGRIVEHVWLTEAAPGRKT